MKIKTIQLQRGISLNIGQHFLKPKVLLEAELSDEDNEEEVFEELQKSIEKMWMRECLECLSELSEVTDHDHIDQYAEDLLNRLDDMEDTDG